MDRHPGGLTLALTQAEFPALYWNLLNMKKAPLAIVVARNTLLLAMLTVALWKVWRLRDDGRVTSMEATGRHA